MLKNEAGDSTFQEAEKQKQKAGGDFNRKGLSGERQSIKGQKRMKMGNKAKDGLQKRSRINKYCGNPY